MGKQGKESAPPATEPPVVEPPSAKVDPPTFDPSVLASSIVDGVTRAFKPAFDALAANSSAGNRTERAAEPVYGDPTEEEWDAAYSAGDAKAIGRLTRRQSDASAARASHTLRKEAIDPFVTAGSASLSSIAERVARGERSVDMVDAYDLYAEEISSALSRLDPQFRSDPKNITFTANAVIAQHLPELKKKWEEAAVRKLRDDPGAARAAGVTRTAVDDRRDADVDVAELIGGETGARAKKALESHPGIRGSFDTFARKAFGLSGAEYAKRFGSTEEH